MKLACPGHGMAGQFQCPVSGEMERSSIAGELHLISVEWLQQCGAGELHLSVE